MCICRNGFTGHLCQNSPPGKCGPEFKGNLSGGYTSPSGSRDMGQIKKLVCMAIKGLGQGVRHLKGLEAKGPFFVLRPSSQHQKGPSDTSKLLIPLTCKILFK